MKSVNEIRALYDEFDKMFGVSTSHMDIELVTKPGNTIASCWYRGVSTNVVPYKFEFNLYYLERLSESSWDDIIRHEYAHAVAMLRTHRSCEHGKVWQDICIKLGCRPSPYSYNLRVMEPLVDYSQNITVSSDEMVPIECARCHAVIMQSKDSRIVAVLKSGRSSWNYRCPKCNGVRFRFKEEAQ